MSFDKFYLQSTKFSFNHSGQLIFFLKKQIENPLKTSGLQSDYSRSHAY